MSLAVLDLRAPHACASAPAARVGPARVAGRKLASGIFASPLEIVSGRSSAQPANDTEESRAANDERASESCYWTTKDPVRFGGGVNLYEYSRSSPIVRRDPAGLDSVLDWVDEIIVFGAPIVVPALPSVGMACSRALPYVAAAGGVAAAAWQTTELVNEWDTETFTDAICDDFGACIDDDDDDGCEQEWEDAYEFCERELARPAPSRRLTGGYTTLSDCARGHVSERCLGNSIDWGEAR